MNEYMIKNNNRREAYLFCLSLFAFTIFMIVISMISAGPIVLGTELNTNGRVEYLCLGIACESLPQMDF